MDAPVDWPLPSETPAPVHHPAAIFAPWALALAVAACALVLAALAFATVTATGVPQDRVLLVTLIATRPGTVPATVCAVRPTHECTQRAVNEAGDDESVVVFMGWNGYIGVASMTPVP